MVLVNQTCIACRKDTKDRLASVGKFGESWDDLLNKIMDAWEAGNGNH